METDEVEFYREKFSEDLKNSSYSQRSAQKIVATTFGIRHNLKTTTHVTVRGPKAEEILERGIKVKEFEVKERNFSSGGSATSCGAGGFGFGITEHIDLGLKYDPSTGIYGMYFYVLAKRAGDRVLKRRRAPGRIGKFQTVSKEDAVKWFQTKFEGLDL